jgi:hypothetical protein
MIVRNIRVLGLTCMREPTTKLNPGTVVSRLRRRRRCAARQMDHAMRQIFVMEKPMSARLTIKYAPLILFADHRPENAMSRTSVTGRRRRVAICSQLTGRCADL